MDSVSNLIRIVRNGTIQSEVKEFTADLWNVTGYLLSIVPGSPQPIINGQPPSADDKAALLDLASVLGKADLPEEFGPFSAVGASGPVPVGSDLSVFFRELGTLGFAKALANFILRVFNVEPAY